VAPKQAPEEVCRQLVPMSSEQLQRALYYIGIVGKLHSALPAANGERHVSVVTACPDKNIVGIATRFRIGRDTTRQAEPVKPATETTLD